MILNRSPWIHYLCRTRQVKRLTRDVTTDVAIVGGGIAGILTAYFLLTQTDRRVALLEGGKVAHGATGHNAGQMTSYFERPFSDIVREFGLGVAAAGQREVEEAWNHLAEIVRTIKLKTPYYRFQGQAGLANRSQVLAFLENNRLRREGGLPLEEMCIANDVPFLATMPKVYDGLYVTVTREEIQSRLETESDKYLAVLSYEKGVMNSAAFTEEVAQYLLATFGKRFEIFEEAYVSEVVLEERFGIVRVGNRTVRAERIVLCTNGFHGFKVTNTHGADIDTAFHHRVHGTVGYMVGYRESSSLPPAAISYFDKEGAPHPLPELSAPYFYLTRRPGPSGKEGESLVCVGGPEEALSDTARYVPRTSCPEGVRQEVDRFLRENYRHHPGDGVDYAFCWHGLMGYTPNGIRLVGIESCNPILLYNLGCNGVGILPSFAGGRRIARIVSKEVLSSSMFDPQDSRCPIVSTIESISSTPNYVSA